LQLTAKLNCEEHSPTSSSWRLSKGAVGDALEQLQEYSYQYNIKILGLSEQSERESAIETSSMCVDLFKSIGADLNISDIDIAHRVPNRRQDGKPRPIICKFARLIAKEIVMN
jgi:hypothetical protein